MTALGGKHRTGSTRCCYTAAVAMTASVLVAGLAACGSGGSTKAGPSASASSGSATAPSSSAAGSTGATSLKTVSTEGVQIQVPSDWSVSQESNGPAGNAPPPSGSSIPPAVFSLQSVPDPLGSTQSHMKSDLDGAGKSGKRLGDLHVNGLSLYHVQYSTAKTFRDEFGTEVDGVFYSISWNFTTVEGITRAKANAYMNPVMATFKLTS